MSRILLATLILLPLPALAHTGHDAGGFASGLLHPLTGSDHLLAMFAVGLWAASLGGRSGPCRWPLSPPWRWAGVPG